MLPITRGILCLQVPVHPHSCQIYLFIYLFLICGTEPRRGGEGQGFGESGVFAFSFPPFCLPSAPARSCLLLPALARGCRCPAAAATGAGTEEGEPKPSALRSNRAGQSGGNGGEKGPGEG